MRNLTINVVQDIATPHNNVLLKSLNYTPGLTLNLWYCIDNPCQYGWKENITHTIRQANIYHADKIDWDFLRYALARKDEEWFIVGWMNPSTRLLVLLFWLSRRRYSMWFDLPHDAQKRSIPRRIVREAMYALVKTSRAQIFCVGQMVVDYFKQRGFPSKRLNNLPIFVSIEKTKSDFTSQCAQVLKKYDVKPTDLFLSAGSRLVFDKGFDILITAIAALKPEEKSRIKCVIVGEGEQKESLKNLIAKNKLVKQIIMEDWMEYADFQAVIATSDVFIHPARFDAYGGAIYAMPLGTPVIGSTGAGASVDRVVEGHNGYFFNPACPKELTRILSRCLSDPQKLEKLGKQARETAKEWHPEKGVAILLKAIR